MVQIDIAKVKVGMFWYEDDTFSFDKTTRKKIKAIVELVENNTIYGDITASELFDIYEKDVNWEQAKSFFEEFSYPCKENEKIVWYDIVQFKSVRDHYNEVRRAFKKLRTVSLFRLFRSSKSKPCRMSLYWSSTEVTDLLAEPVLFSEKSCGCTGGGRKKKTCFYVRPVLALKVA